MQSGTQADGRRRKCVCVLRGRELETVIAAYRNRDEEVPRYGRRGRSLPHDGVAQRAFWASKRTIRDRNGEWVLQGEACRLAGVASSMLCRWTTAGCPSSAVKSCRRWSMERSEAASFAMRRSEEHTSE